MGLSPIVGEDVSGPDQGPAGQIQAVEDAGRAHGENPVSSDGRRGARADAGYGALVASRVGMLPELAARCQVVAGRPVLRGRVAPE